MFALYIFKVLYSTHSLATVYQCSPPRLGARDRPFVPNPTFSPGLPARLCELTESSILGPAQLYSPAPFPDSHPPSRLMVPTALNSPNKRWSNSHCAKSWGSHSGQNQDAQLVGKVDAQTVRQDSEQARAAGDCCLRRRGTGNLAMGRAILCGWERVWSGVHSKLAATMGP